jgi:hypothetical protein
MPFAKSDQYSTWARVSRLARRKIGAIIVSDCLETAFEEFRDTENILLMKKSLKNHANII